MIKVYKKWPELKSIKGTDRAEFVIKSKQQTQMLKFSMMVCLATVTMANKLSLSTETETSAAIDWKVNADCRGSRPLITAEFWADCSAMVMKDKKSHCHGVIEPEFDDLPNGKFFAYC